LVKTDSSGNQLWNKTYGGNGAESVKSLVQTSDGGYALAGYTDSFGAGDCDAWLVKTDENGAAPNELEAQTQSPTPDGSSTNQFDIFVIGIIAAAMTTACLGSLIYFVKKNKKK
jgi:hypothetical protein